MPDKLDQIADKLEKVISHLEATRAENVSLKKAVKALTRELSGLKKDNEKLKLEVADKAETARTKLTSIINRLDRLQQAVD